CDDQIRARPCVAEQHLALGALGCAQRIARERPHLAGDHLALAGPAHTLAAGIGDVQSGALRGVEDGLVRLARKAKFGTGDSDLERHSGSAISVSTREESHTTRRLANFSSSPAAR